MAVRVSMLSQPAPAVQFEVLFYKEDDGWIALVLDMDIRGYGGSPREAANDVKGLIAVQIGFALVKDQIDSMFYKAEEKYYDMFERARIRYFKGTKTNEECCEIGYLTARVIKDKSHGDYVKEKEHDYEEG